VLKLTTRFGRHGLQRSRAQFENHQDARTDNLGFHLPRLGTHHVNLLLPDEVGGRRLTDMSDMKRIEDASLGQVECVRVEGREDIPADSYGEALTVSLTLWIDKEAFLLRRIDWIMSSQDFRSRDTKRLTSPSLMGRSSIRCWTSTSRNRTRPKTNQ